jgi:hypothetical protein
MMFLVTLVAAWVRFHDQIHEWFRTVAEQASPTKALERQAAEREEAEERERAALAESRRLAGLPPEDDDDEDEETEDEDDDDRPAPRPRQPRPTKPKPKPTTGGVRGGTSAKPIGRKRDLARRDAAADPDDDDPDDGFDDSDEASTDE